MRFLPSTLVLSCFIDLSIWLSVKPKVAAQICRVPLSWNNDVVFLTALRVGHKQHSTSSAAQLKSKSFQHAFFGFRNANSKGTWDAPTSTQWQINFWLQKLTEKIFENHGKTTGKTVIGEGPSDVYHRNSTLQANKCSIYAIHHHGWSHGWGLV